MKNKKERIKLGLPVATTGKLPETMALAGVIRRHRQRRGLSLNRFAANLGVSRQMLSGVEADKYLPGLDVLGLIARRLGTSGSRLLREAERWVARLPEDCHACKYACMARGQLKWLSAHRQCTRPQTAPSVPAATLPDSH